MPIVSRRARLAACLLALAAVSACDGGGTERTFDDTLVGRFEARERYAPLADALAITGLDQTLRADGPFTVLAPTETAFRFLGSDFSPVLFSTAQLQTLGAVLRHHVVAGILTADDFADGATLTALDGATLTVRRIGPVVTVNGVTLDVTDPTEASNGVAFPLADVLLDGIETAERVRLSPSLTQLSAGFFNTGVLGEVPAGARVTVLAPTNDAFLSLGPLSQSLFNADNLDIFGRALRAHVLPGDVDLAALVGQTVTTLAGDRLPVTRTDGVLRVGDVRVIGQETTADGRLYLVGAPVLSTLRVYDQIRVQPGLVRYRDDVLSTPDVQALLADPSTPVTVFAPTNSAYDARSLATSQLLVETQQAPLVRRLVAAHVVRGRYTPADLTDGLVLTAVDGTALRVERSGTTIRVDGIELPDPLIGPDGVVYVVGTFVRPDVDLFDQLILSGFAGFARAVRLGGLESAYRTTVRTAFVLQDALVPTLLGRPDLATVLRRTATTEAIPRLANEPNPRPFTALNGDTRTLVQSPDCEPGDGACSRYGLGTKLVVVRPVTMPPDYLVVSDPQVYQGFSTKSGRQTLHYLRTVDGAPPPDGGVSRP